MKIFVILSLVSGSALAAPIDVKPEDSDFRVKKSPQFGLLPFFNPFVPLMNPTLPGLMRSQDDLKIFEEKSNYGLPQSHNELSKGYEGSYGSPAPHGAVGVFPSVNTIGAIPYLLSCSPNVVTGHLAPPKPAYREAGEEMGVHHMHELPIVERSANLKASDLLKPINVHPEVST